MCSSRPRPLDQDRLQGGQPLAPQSLQHLGCLSLLPAHVQPWGRLSLASSRVGSGFRAPAPSLLQTPRASRKGLKGNQKVRRILPERTQVSLEMSDVTSSPDGVCRCCPLAHITHQLIVTLTGAHALVHSTHILTHVRMRTHTPTHLPVGSQSTERKGPQVPAVPKGVPRGQGTCSGLMGGIWDEDTESPVPLGNTSPLPLVVLTRVPLEGGTVDYA